jgi:hypothetical protein
MTEGPAAFWAQRALCVPGTSLSGLIDLRPYQEEMTMAENKKVKAAPKKAAKKTLKGSKKLGETKLMLVN